MLSSMSLAKTRPMRRAGLAPVTSIPVKSASATLNLPRRVRGLSLASLPAVRVPPHEIRVTVTHPPTKLGSQPALHLAQVSDAPVLTRIARFAPATFTVSNARSVVSLARAIPGALSPPAPGDRGQYTSVLRLSTQAKVSDHSITTAILTAPPPPVHKRFAAGTLANLPTVRHVPLPVVATATFDSIRMATSRASDAATAEDREKKDERHEGEQRQQTDARARELLFDLLAKKRRLIVKGKNDRWTVPGDLVERAGLSIDRIEEPAFQQHLQQEAARQRHELGSLAAFLAPAPGERLIRTNAGFTLHDDAPDVLRRAVFGWRNDPAVQHAFQQFAELPPITEGDEQAATARRDLFLQLVHRRHETKGARERAMDRKNGALGRYPDFGHGGISD